MRIYAKGRNSTNLTGWNQGYVATSDPGVLEGWNLSMFFLNLQPLQHFVVMFAVPDKCTRGKKRGIYAIRECSMISAIVNAM